MTSRFGLAAAAVLVLGTSAVHAQIAVTANDGKLILKEGASITAPTPKPDTATIIDLNVFPPRILATVETPASVIGPPMSVAIAPDASFALVTGAMKLGPDGKMVPNDALSVIDLKTNKVIQTLAAGAGAAGIAINPAGTLAVVANRSEGTLSSFAIAGTMLTPLGKTEIGTKDSGPSAVAFTPDGTRALVTRDGDHTVTVIAVDGTRLGAQTTQIAAGLRPYGIVIRPQGDYAIVANIGRTPGDAQTVSVIDLKSKFPHVVNTISVGPTPEGLALSPDGNVLAVTVMNGSNQPATSPDFHPFGLLKLYRVKGATLTPLTEAHIGRWCQGVAWNRAATVLLAECMGDDRIEIFRFDGKHLKPAGALAVTGPAGIAVAP